jgi:hypothetical protein
MLVAAAAALALAGCSQEEADTLEKAFENQIDSAQVSMRFDMDMASGEDGTFTVTGPYERGEEGELERFDWTMKGEFDGSPPFEMRAVSDGERVLLEYKNTLYEASGKDLEALRAGAQGEDPQLEDIDRLPGVDLKSWFPESDTEEDGEVAGEETTHISGRLDVSKALTDIAALTKNPTLRRQLGLAKNDRISKTDIRMLDRFVSDPRFDIHVGKDDDKLRRIAGALKFRIPGEGVRGKMGFAVEYAKVDEPVEISAPEGKTRPIDDLTKRLGVEG